MGAQLTAQYNPQAVSQISLTTSSKYYNIEFQNALFALMKQHQLTVRGIINTTDDEDYKYEMDIGFDEEVLVGHTERTDGQQLFTSDIDAKRCSVSGKYSRCYRGDITIRAGNSGPGRKGSFDISYGTGTAKLDIRVPENIELKFDHTHTGRLRDEDFNSKTTIEGRSFRANNRRAFSYTGAVDKEDGKWNNLNLQSTLVDKNGQKAVDSNIRMKQQVLNKLTGQYQRKIDVNLERKGKSATFAKNPLIV